MATARQIEANRKNALASTGPKSTEGKERSRGNATTHGLSSAGPAFAATHSDAFAERKAEWAESIRPTTVEADLALDVVIAASFRIEECDRAYNAIAEEQMTRARLTWAQDRRLEAATLMSRIRKDPALIVAQLEATCYGVEALIAAWMRLGDIYYIQNDWTEADCDQALDLLGVPVERRSGKIPIVCRPEADLRQFRQTLVHLHLERLQKLKDNHLDQIDALQRRHAEAGATVILSKPATLILRYQREALRTYHKALRDARNPGDHSEAPAPVETAPTPEPATDSDDALLARIEAADRQMEAAKTDAEIQAALDEADAIHALMARRQAILTPVRDETNPISAAPTTAHRTARSTSRAFSSVR